MRLANLKKLGKNFYFMSSFQGRDEDRKKTRVFEIEIYFMSPYKGSKR
jgi:hypothetical protein